MADVSDEALSERELEILRLVATGVTNRQIALRLAISHNTVKVHLRNIFAKIGVESRTEATLVAIQRGWVQVPNALGEAAGLERQAAAPYVPLSWGRRAFL
ncbi:MAG: response regulator transcription factor, partial [Anaerolineae bacterium]|nr:response regulator transcription factor [Anaerolineae bacterium]